MRVFAVMVSESAPVLRPVPPGPSLRSVLVSAFASVARQVFLLRALRLAFYCLFLASSFEASVSLVLATVFVLPASVFVAAVAQRILVVAALVFFCQAFSCVIRVFSPPACVREVLVTVFVPQTTPFPPAAVVHCQVFQHEFRDFPPPAFVRVVGMVFVVVVFVAAMSAFLSAAVAWFLVVKKLVLYIQAFRDVFRAPRPPSLLRVVVAMVFGSPAVALAHLAVGQVFVETVRLLQTLAPFYGRCAISSL